MKKFVPHILLLGCYVSALSQTVNDNIIVVEERSIYNLREKDGRLSEVKNVDTRSFLAQRADASALSVSFYNSDIVIDRASAPGAKPLYRDWEDDDLFYTGARVCYMRIPLKRGREAKAVVERTYKAPQQFCEILLTSPYYTQKAIYEINVPSALASVIDVHPVRLPAGVELQCEQKKGGALCYKVEMDSLVGYSRKYLAPASSISSPKLVITGLFKNVDELYSFMKGSVDREDNSGELEDMARKITSGLDEDIDRVNAITSWVRQNVRYLAVEHGEYAFRPDHASEVYRKRFGDCKGSANLIKAMLKCVGIDGRLVWVGTADQVDTDWTDIPAVSSGNHMIAAAVLSDTIVYLDGTASYCPRGYYSPSITGRQVIIEDGDNYIISHIPYNSGTPDCYRFRASYNIDGDALKGEMKHELNGIYRMSFANVYNGLDASRRSKFVRNYIAPENKVVDCWDIVVDEGVPDNANTIISARVSEPKTVTAIDDKLYLNLRPLRNLSLKTIDMKERNTGMRLSFPFRIISDIDIEIPEGYELDSSMESAEICSSWFSGKVEYKENDGVINCKTDISIVRSEASLNEIPLWNSALKEVMNIANTQLTLIKCNKK